MRYTVIIKVDTNDADYVEHATECSAEFVCLLRKAIPHIKKVRNHNWPTGGMEYGNEDPYVLYEGVLTVDEIQAIDESIPYTEYGSHSIESIRVAPKVEWETLL